MIGGEFEIRCSHEHKNTIPTIDFYYYASGRSSLFQILKLLRPERRRIWLPDYLCHSIVDAVIRTGYEYFFYSLDSNLTVSPIALSESGFREGDVILIINYFGLQELIWIAKSIKDAFRNTIIIEDDVQAYFSFIEDPNPFADFRFTSLRKGFPVPDGGVIYSKRSMPIVNNANSFSVFKLKAGRMKALRGKPGINDKDYLSLFEIGERLIDENYESGMSENSRRLFSNVDCGFVKSRRKENARILMKGLMSLGIRPAIPVPEDKVPLFIPVILPNRDLVRKRMFANQVFCPVHWPAIQGIKLNTGRKMAKYELSLIVDQRYGQNEMEEILSML